MSAPGDSLTPMKRLVGLALLLTLLTGCTPAPSHDVDSFVEAVEGLDGVESLTRGAEDWVIEIDPSRSAEELNELGVQLFELVNDTDFGSGNPTFEAVVGSLTAAIEIDPETGGAPPMPPALGWAAPLRDLPVVESATVENRGLRVGLGPDTDVLGWVQELRDADLSSLDEHRAVVSAPEGAEGLASITLVPADDELSAVIDDVIAAAEETSTTVRSTDAALSTPKVAARVDDVAQAGEFVDALAARLGDRGAELSIETLTGESYHDDLDDLVDGLDGVAGLPALVADTGAELTSTSLDRESFSIAVADVDELVKVIDLIGSAAWKPGPDSMVSITVGDDTEHSRQTARGWQSEGPLLVAAHEAGLTDTRILPAQGGSRERTFDIDFGNTDDLDVTTPEGYGRIIDVMRGHTWEGEAQIHFSEGDHLIFWSTAEGTAQDAYFSLSGAPSREPTGWALDFLEAWDATAS